MNTSALICADCSSPDPQWASINRGVLICNECCSVHRSLGRHISHIRSLRAPNWPPVLKEMVFTLVNKGANSLWEHGLHNSKVKLKKPGPRDKLHPSKNDFIIAKYKHLQMLPRLSQKDNPNALSELSKQLHASVRTNNLETCLRLLALGANPNFKHPDRGNTPLHVAAQAGQAMQVELLVVHGANPCTLDNLGHTPEECARIAGHHQLADRLIETQYELTDKLSFFLCGRKPVHSIGEHYLVPNVSGSGLNIGLSEANTRLQELSNELFEQLACDVYDEVDRRETDAIWLTTEQLQSSIAFLPVNPILSPLRNQGRQKLATLDAQAFAQLVVDLLLDTKRRQTISLETGQTSGTAVPCTGEDNPPTPTPLSAPPTSPPSYDPHDYDEVPVDESGKTGKQHALYDELANVPMPNTQFSVHPTNPYAEVNREMTSGGGGEGNQLEVVEGLTSPVQKMHPTVVIAEEEEKVAGEGGSVEELRQQLRKVTKEKEQLRQTNAVLQKTLSGLQKQLNKVIEENCSLRNSVARSPPATSSSPPAMEQIQEEEGEEEGEGGGKQAPVYAQVDMSKKTNRFSGHHSSNPTSPPHSPSPSTLLPISHTQQMQLHSSKSSASSNEPVTPPPARQDTPLSDSAFDDDTGGAVSNPSMEVVHSHIKIITKCIQELLQAAQAHKQSSFGPCSLKTTRAIDTMAKLFPAKPSSQAVQVSLREMVSSSQRLRSECTQTGHSDIALHTRQIINSAYDVAKAARHLVMCCEQDQQK